MKRKMELRENEWPFLSSSIPDLGLNDFAFDGHGPSLELNANGGLGIQAELVLSEPW